MNILVLMAGGDEAFHDAGYRYPKNLVEIAGLPLVQHVAKQFAPFVSDAQTRFTFLVKGDEIGSFHTDDVLQLLLPNAHVIPVQEPTGGAACTALLAVESVNNDEPLLLCNGDMIVDADLQSIVAGFVERDLDGGIVVFDAVHPRWSYVKTNDDGCVIETAEKRPISKNATAGIYYFKHGRDFVQAACEMIKKDAHVGGAFYVCPTYNELILRQKRIGVAAIDRTAYHSLSDPRSVADYEEFLRGR